MPDLYSFQNAVGRLRRSQQELGRRKPEKQPEQIVITGIVAIFLSFFRDTCTSIDRNASNGEFTPSMLELKDGVVAHEVHRKRAGFLHPIMGCRHPWQARYYRAWATDQKRRVLVIARSTDK